MTQIGSSAEEDSRQNDDNAILTLVLRQAFIQQCYEDGTVYEDEDFHDVGGFTVVDQNTAPFGFNWSYPPEVLAGACVTFGGYEPNDPRELEKYIYKNIKIQDYDISNLVDLLLERNKKSVRLSLESLPKDGYIIDYDGTYARYFEEKGGGWEKWRKDHPEAHGYTQVSLPAYDKEKGLVLVYHGIQSDWLVGVGSIDVYRYKDGKLEHICGITLWVS